MSTRPFTLRAEHKHQSCPKCGNREKFTAHSEQVMEDLCNVWVECACGFDPTADRTGYRHEDVWGGINAQTVAVAMDCWDDAIHAMQAVPR